MVRKQKAKVIGIVSIKGGVGKTTAVVNLAYELSHTHAQRVLVVDGDLSNPNVGLHLGFTKYPVSLHDALAQSSKTLKAVYAHEFGFHVMPGSLNPKQVNPLALARTVNSLRAHYDYILVDSSPNLNKETYAVMQASDELYVVSSPDAATLSATLRATRLAKEKNVKVAGLILNQVRGRKYELSVADMEKLSKTPVVGVLHDNSNVLKALSAVQPFVKMFPHSSTALAYRDLASFITGSPVVSSGKLAEFKGALHDDFHKFVSHDFKQGLRYYR